MFGHEEMPDKSDLMRARRRLPSRAARGAVIANRHGGDVHLKATEMRKVRFTQRLTHCPKRFKGAAQILLGDVGGWLDPQRVWAAQRWYDPYVMDVQKVGGCEKPEVVLLRNHSKSV